MSISVRRLKTDIPYESSKLKKDAKIILNALEYGDFSLNVLLTNNATIQKYNREYRSTDKPTDILSFSFHEATIPGEKIEVCCEEEQHLGDLIISLEYIKNDLQKWNEPFEKRLQTLLVHGICHLLGYDHEKDIDYATMHKEESRLLKLLGR